MTRIKRMWQQYPSKFWVIVVTTFIDVIGATLIFSFFALYITQRFNVGMTQAGTVDEAVAVLQQYNIEWGSGPAPHYLIADRIGRRRWLSSIGASCR